MFITTIWVKEKQISDIKIMFYHQHNMKVKICKIYNYKILANIIFKKLLKR
jgi:hypothetical protein